MKGCKIADDEDVISMVNAWLKSKINNSSTAESKLWRNAGPKVHLSCRRLC